MIFRRKIYETRQQKVLDFVLGFCGFIVLDGLLAAALLNPQFLEFGALHQLGGWAGGLVLLINIVVLACLGYWRSYACLGALSALGAALLFVLVIGLFAMVVCFTNGIN